MDFFKFQKKNLFTYFLLSIFAKTLPESYVSDVAAPKKKVFPCLRRQKRRVLRLSINVAAITSCLGSRFPVSIQRKGIFNLVWFTNQEQLPVFW